MQMQSYHIPAWINPHQRNIKSHQDLCQNKEFNTQLPGSTSMVQAPFKSHAHQGLKPGLTNLAHCCNAGFVQSYTDY